MPSLLRKILAPLGRRRRSLGFGIHSPFAYHFITEVLRQRHPYYSYSKLGSRRERTVFRIAVDLHPRRVALSGSCAYLANAIHAAWSDTEICSSPVNADMVICTDPAEAAEQAAKGCHIILLASPGAAMAALRSQLSYGMTFISSDMTVAVNLPYLPYQEFRLNF